MVYSYSTLALALMCGPFFGSAAKAVSLPPENDVSVTVETLPLLTYKLGADEKHPLFRDLHIPGQNVFRGERPTYPYPRSDRFQQVAEMVNYRAITLENEFVKAVILPDLRGRVQGAYDKRNDWDYLYFNHVIKPADIGVRGAWIAGGLEWNHPGGHGYTQFSRISHRILENDDGSKTVLVAEVEPNRKMKWETAITLRPGSRALETEGRFYSIAPYPVPFASSLNAAVHVTGETQTIFPEGAYFTGHGKKWVELWPYREGVDHSWYKNTPMPVSIFSEGLFEDWYGSYAHDRNAGTLVVADHRTAPGKKYFTWGSGPMARRWDTLLSDNDGPYLELQVGAFWENLGYGYAWLDPYEVKKYNVLWYGVKDIGGFVKANQHLALNLEENDRGELFLGIDPVHAVRRAEIRISTDRLTVYRSTTDLDPAQPYLKAVAKPAGIKFGDLKVTVIDGATRTELMRYRPLQEVPPEPKLPPREKGMAEMSLDELLMWGKSFYQDPFSKEAEAYFEEMLRREPLDSRGNREMGVLHYHRGLWAEAREFLERSLRHDPLNEGYATHYFLGLTAIQEEDLDRARRELTVASRRGEWRNPALYQLAVVAMRSGDYAEAVRYLKEGIEHGAIHPIFWSTLAVAYRKDGMGREAGRARASAMQLDELEFLALTEGWLSGEIAGDEVTAQFDRKDSSFVGSDLFVQMARTYIAFGAWEDAVRILELGVHHFEGQARVYPMLDYYLGWIWHHLDREEDANEAFARAAGRDPDYVFPYHPLDLLPLRKAVSQNPMDSHAWLYLGNGLFNLRRFEEACNAWNRCLAMQPHNTMALRNLALGTWVLEREEDRSVAIDKTITLLEQAIQADPTDARILMELDLFYDASGKDELSRALFESHESVVRSRDDLVLRWARLLLRVNDFSQAVELMDETRFPGRESRAGIHAAYAEAHCGLGQRLLEDGQPREALRHFLMSMEYPANLAEGRIPNEVFAKAHYLAGLATEALGLKDEASAHWTNAIKHRAIESSEAGFYQALALKKLGDTADAYRWLRELAANNRKALVQESSAIRSYVLSCALAELGESAEADEQLRRAVKADPDVRVNAAAEAAVPVNAVQPLP